jgi:hypothetical protein
MSAAFVQTWPGSRVLLGWWREVAVRKPQQLHLSRLLLHHVEALVQVRKPRPLDRWQRALLGLVGTRVPYGGESLSPFTDLQMDPQMLGQFLRELTESGLLHRNGSGLWQMTAAGRHALETGAVTITVEERRTLTFVDNSALGRPPHFLPLSRGHEPDSSRTEDHPFEIALLQTCIRQTPQWKARFHFPIEIEDLLPPRPDDSPSANWRRVILDAVEQRPYVFIHMAQSNAAPLLLGFCVGPEHWTLEPEPQLALAEGWEEALPDLAAEPSPQMWRQAWQTWSHPRSLPPAEVAACRLERVDHRLLVHAPPRLIDRLRAARSDAVKQEAWLLAGEGRTRTAAQIELHPL